MPNPLPARLALGSLVIVLALLSCRSARAGLAGQPAPAKEAAETIRTEAANVLKGEIATARPNLFLAVQANAATDFTDLVARVIGDDTSYEGLVSTLEEALAAATDPAHKADIIYNLARIHLLRSNLVRSSAERRAPLAAAADAADRFPSDISDPAAWALKGDIKAELGDLEGALAAYKQMTSMGATGAEVRYKDGWAYERTNHIAEAAAAYASAVRALSTSGGDPKWVHDIYQGVARIDLAQGDDGAALLALARSAKVSPDDSTPFRFRLEAATRLLQHGYAREVLAYTNAALAANPDDPDAKALHEKALAAAHR